MPRKKPPPERFNMWMPPPLREALEEAAHEARVSLAGYVREAVEEKLGREQPPPSGPGAR